LELKNLWAGALVYVQRYTDKTATSFVVTTLASLVFRIFGVPHILGNEFLIDENHAKAAIFCLERVVSLDSI